MGKRHQYKHRPTLLRTVLLRITIEEDFEELHKRHYINWRQSIDSFIHSSIHWPDIELCLFRLKLECHISNWRKHNTESSSIKSAHFAVSERQTSENRVNGAQCHHIKPCPFSP